MEDDLIIVVLFLLLLARADRGARTQLPWGHLYGSNSLELMESDPCSCILRALGSSRASTEPTMLL